MISLLFSSYKNKEIQESFQRPIKILNLVLYSSDNGGPYDKMKQITEEFYKKFTNVRTIYYRFSNDINKNIELRDNILYIKGRETYIPGILQKTLHAFEYFQNENYDYLVRSNISTIIRFDILTHDLLENPVDYGCGLCFGKEYSSGTSIILSSNIVKKIVKYKNEIDMSMIDDMSIGDIINRKIPEIEMKPVLTSLENNGFFIIPDSDEKTLHEFIESNKIVFFRNRNEDREKDVRQMKIIVDYITPQYQ